MVGVYGIPGPFSSLLMPGKRQDSRWVFAVAAFASQGQRKLGLLSIPSVPTSHTRCLSPSLRKGSFISWGLSASVGRWQPRFWPQEGFTASLTEVWEEVPGPPVVHKQVLQKGTCCSRETWVEQGQEDTSWGSSPLSIWPGPGGCFKSATHTINRPSFLPTLLPKLGKIQAP